MDVGGQDSEEDRSSTSIVKINIYERESPLLSPSPTLISPAGKKISFHCPGELAGGDLRGDFCCKQGGHKKLNSDAY